MKAILFYIVIAAVIGFTQVASATPVTVEFVNGVSSGGVYSVDVIVSGIPQGGAVAAYNLDVLFNTDRLKATSIVFYGALGHLDTDPLPGLTHDNSTVRQYSTFSNIDGVYNFWEMTRLTDAAVLNWQTGGTDPLITGGTLNLATLYFTDTGSGDSGLAFDWYIGRDVKGLNNEIIAGYVPEPGTFLLVGSGLLSLLGFRRKSSLLAWFRRRAD